MESTLEPPRDFSDYGNAFYGNAAGASSSLSFRESLTTNPQQQVVQRRHLLLRACRDLCCAGGCCSVIMTTQVYNKTSAPLRKAASHLFLWKTSNMNELGTIYDDTKR